jgi:hypothetical protein
MLANLTSDLELVNDENLVVAEVQTCGDSMEKDSGALELVTFDLQPLTSGPY